MRHAACGSVRGHFTGKLTSGRYAGRPRPGHRHLLTERPVRTTAEAADRIAELTGLHRGLTQTRIFLAGLGFTWQRTRADPVPPKSR